MKVITLNVNGIRAAARKGFFDWLQSQQADVICLQETKAQLAQLSDPIFHPEGYHCYYYDAEKKGYSGVALFCRQQPLAITHGLGWPCADQEGRYIQADFADVSVASLYLPSGTSGDERQALKYDFLERFAPYLQALKQSRPNLILCGDWNIAHKAIDLKNWRANQKHSGFLPEERAWMDELFNSLGFVDAFRVINTEPDQYTWWSNRGQAWAKNVGWRIDYQIITQSLADKVERAEIYKAQRFSDHAPLTIEYA
jgi:exodeoxyribonuclease III